jgi:hypothetical protein
MKNLMKVSAMLLVVFFCSCGWFSTDNSEDPAVKKVEDSLIEVDRDNSLDAADRMLREADSLEQLRQDSIAKAQAKK